MSGLTGKIAVITGASKGIGAGIVKNFGAEGASVVVNYASDKKGADRVVSEITSKGVAAKSAVDGITRALAKELGPKKIRVNSINPGTPEDS